MSGAPSEVSYDVDRLLELLAISVMFAYRNTLVGNPAPAIKRYRERMSNPEPGDLVLEVTNWGAPAVDRIGRLKSMGMENPPPEVVSEDNYDEAEWGRPYPPYQEQVWRIETLDGREFRWWNANFIVIPESLEPLKLTAKLT